MKTLILSQGKGSDPKAFGLPVASVGVSPTESDSHIFHPLGNPFRTLLLFVVKRLSIGLLLLLALAVTSCATKGRARAEAQAAFIAGQQQAQSMSQPQAPSVLVRGEVKKPLVPWTEDLTLARAIVAAEYTGTFDPREILLIRKGETLKFNPRRLLRGADDVPLAPGDIVELRR
jgi:hypothetical protein